MKFMTFFSLTFFLLSHPMYMLMTIIMVTLLSAILIYKSMKILWIPFIFTLLILGGMFILFLYMISLIPNKKLFLNKKMIIVFILFFVNFSPFNSQEMSFLLMNLSYSPSSMNMIVLMMTYLIMTLMVVMKIMTSSNAPLTTL
uniref:NADH dehydrogenase subunit 6 n=1 Tax=Ixodes nuttallianus TaxID=213687 RepID=A0A976R4J4_9ACAR|nr:NADH dehydrogenase subunit 6 [Ixodes nuttallianus]UNO53790.1 NADH dehydrogenase subunit 6 [Ixodes nuttallianus]